MKGVKTLPLGLAALALLVGAAWLFTRAPNRDRDLGIQRGQGPWAPEKAHLRSRLSSFDIPLMESSAPVHRDAYLLLVVRGEELEIPNRIGHGDGFLSVLHTHDTTGVIHLESPVDRPFTLGDFFDTWGVRLSSRCLGGYCNNSREQLAVFVDGTKWSGSPRSVALQQGLTIVLAYGSRGSLPSPIPSENPFT